jgi:hypothetical protein
MWYDSVMSTSTQSVEASILSRLICPERPSLSPEAAQGILSLRFDDAETRRMNQLAEKAREGTLSPDEQALLDGYERIGSLIGLLHSKARQSLKKAGINPDNGSGHP